MNKIVIKTFAAAGYYVIRRDADDLFMAWDGNPANPATWQAAMPTPSALPSDPIAQLADYRKLVIELPAVQLPPGEYTVFLFNDAAGNTVGFDTATVDEAPRYFQSDCYGSRR